MTNCARANSRPRKISVCKSALDVRRARLWGGRGSPACIVLRDPRGVAVAVGRCRLVLSSASAPVQMYVQPPPVGLRGDKTRCGGMVWPWACLLRFLLPFPFLLHPYGKYSAGSSNECPPVPWVPCRSAGAGGVGIWSRLPQLVNSILLVTIRRRRSFPVCSRLWVLSLIRRACSPYWVRSFLFYVDIQIFAAPLVYLPAVRYSSCNLQIQQGGEYIKFNLPHRSHRCAGMHP